MVRTNIVPDGRNRSKPDVPVMGRQVDEMESFVRSAAPSDVTGLEISPQSSAATPRLFPSTGC